MARALDQSEHIYTVDTPLGAMAIEASATHIIAARWGEGRVADTAPAPSALLAQAAAQVAAYFDGTRLAFDLPLAPRGSEVQRRACAAMSAIPFGETRSYGEIAREIGVSAQAMGQLCGGNSIPIIIPCHRVLAASGLGGFSGTGGIEDKVWLLRHEGAAGLLI